MQTEVILPKKSWFTIALGLLAALALAGGVALADNVQCSQQKGCSVTVNQTNGNLIISYDITGLGGTAAAQFVVDFDLSGHARCKNNGNNCPSAANKFGAANLSQTGTFPVHNGRASGTITVVPQTGLDCPGKQAPIILDVSWTNITFTVEGVQLIDEPGPLNASPLASCP
jgi:hypothetical protein